MEKYRHGIPIPKFLLFIMRMTLFLFVLGVFQAYAVDSYAQKTQLTLRENKIELGELFHKIEQQTDFYFFYSNNRINKHRKVSVDVKDKMIFEILDVVLNNTDIAYQVHDKAIVLSIRDKKDIRTESQQQTKRRIIGKVVDTSGIPVIGANIIEAGTTNGTVTDIDGNFVLEVENEAVIRVSYIGYNSLNVEVDGRTQINIVMKEDSQLMDELVVIGYGQQSKATITGAIASVNTDELLKSPTTSLGNALAGRLPGYSAIQYSGLPGFDDPSVLVRGVGTLSTGGSSPLVLVDGVERSFTQLDPNEVEDITILKDAGATAVFGVRGANGVILVTTKRGGEGRPNISASASFGVQQPTKMLKFADSYTYATTVMLILN